MGAATSKEMAAATLVTLPPTLITLVMRFWIRLQRSAWGRDDWAMVATIPVWLISQVGLIGMAWSGTGQLDSTLSEQQKVNSLFWFYVFQEFWCFTLVALKWCLGFTLLRISDGMRWVEFVVYGCLALVTICTGGTGMYLFFQCDPVEKNWYTTTMPGGTCQPREIQTALSFLVAAVSITTDWIFASLPFVLIWRLQMPNQVKASVIGLLSLGLFASIAPIVRLKYLLLLNDNTRFLQGLGIILAWAQAEVGIGMLVANLPACRPLLEKILSRLASTISSSSGNKSSSNSKSGLGLSSRRGGTAAAGANNGSSSGVVVGIGNGKSNNHYYELDEREAAVVAAAAAASPTNIKKHGGGGGGGGEGGGHRHSTPGLETRVYGLGSSSSSSEEDLRDDDDDDDDDHSQKRIISSDGNNNNNNNNGRGVILVERQFGTEVDENAGRGDRRVV